ncbi:MAG: anthranilate synthase component I family protein [Bacteroidetes bacterium]|nr:MAG: anthranilate synthase component I family protein [Bacteroidota bacterium]
MSLLRSRLLSWASQFPCCAVFDTCGSDKDRYGSYEWLIGVGGADAQRIETWAEFEAHRGRWLMGILPYELKNRFEPGLRSRRAALVSFPEVAFFVPDYVVMLPKGSSQPLWLDAEGRPLDPLPLESVPSPEPPAWEKPSFSPFTSQEAYLESIRTARAHIREGDFYEINLSRAFVAEYTLPDPVALYQQLTRISPMPFSAFVRYGEKYLISASPERFLQLKDGYLSTQPIKGTAPRGATPEEDELLRRRLRRSVKEKAENIMIVDLSRHDLHRSCVTGSVTVPHLFDIQSFAQLHQMVSTIRGRLRPDVSAPEAIARTFPPGSMTGAPKVMTMDMIDQFEPVARGAYAGSAGYISPSGEFDLSVIIRSLIYDASACCLSYHVGGAITYDSAPEKEWAETEVKAEAIRQLFGIF